MSAWATAWLLSGASAAVTYRSVRKAGMQTHLAMVLASVCFFAPLGVTMRSGNSVAYVFDLFVPLILWRCATSLRTISGSAFMSGALVLLSAGLLPLLTSIGYASSRPDWLLAAINCYRLAGVVGAFFLVSAAVERGSVNDFRMCVALSLGVLVILGSALCQWAGVLDVNIFSQIASTYRADYVFYEDSADEKFLVFGFFKGEQGILAMIAFALGLAITGMGRSAVGLALMFSALLLAFVTGSKTTILACLLMVPVAAMLSRSIKLVAAGAIASCCTIAFCAWVRAASESSLYVNSTLYNLIVSDGQDIQTLAHRFGRYTSVLDILGEDVRKLFGIYTRPIPEFNVAYFHNEYLSVLALSGLVGVLLYLVGLGILAKRLLTVNPRLPIANRAAVLLLFGNLIQGATVAHVQPGFLFVTSAALSFVVYALGAAREKTQSAKAI